MKDENKTKKQLINELKELRNQIREQTQTDHMEMTQLLQDSEKRFTCLVESASDAILTVDRHGNMISWNKAAEIVFGYSADEIVGKPFFLLVPERFVENSRKAMEQMVTMDDTSHFVGKVFEHTGLRKDGSEFTAEISCAACETKEGLLLTAIVRDTTERKCVEEALLESEARYREFVQNANSIILRMDLKGNITFFNEFAQSFFGYSEGEIIGRNAVGTIVPEMDSSGRDLAAMIEDIGNRPESYANNENENMCRNGKRVWVAWTNKGVYDKGGKVTEILCVGNDITNHKQADEEVKKFKTIIEQADYGVAISDLEGNLTYLNSCFAEMHGYTVEEVIGQNLSIFHNQEQMNRVRQLNEELIKTGSYEVKEVWHKRKDSTVFPALMSAAVVKDEEGKPIFLSATAMDLSKRKQTEKELVETKDYLDNIIESSLDCIVVSDNKGHITKANRSFFNLLGYKEGEVIGKVMAEFSPSKEGIYKSTTGELVEIDKAFLDRTSRAVSKFLRDGKITNWDGCLVQKNQKVVPVDLSVVILYDNEQNRIGSVGILRDITDRKRAEGRLVEYQNRLKSLATQLTLTEEKVRRDFAAFLHDQVGQALFISKIKLGTIKEEASSTNKAKSVEEVINIIDQTIQETRSLTFELSPPILYQLGLEAALEWLVEQMRERYSMTIYFEDDKRSKPLDESVSTFLFRAVRELLINIGKHAKAQHVKVILRIDGENVKVCVEDDGVGFAVFKNGFSNHKNDGFGLFSIEERLDNLGGRLDIESEKDRGTSVTITAPLK